MARQALLLILCGAIYALFAAACFRLAVIHEYEAGISLGEGLFAAAGAAGLFLAVTRPRGQALIVVAGTLPLVGWFAATPWNSGAPFLISSLVVPVIAAAAFLRQWRRRVQAQA